MKKDLQAFEQLKELASGQQRPRVQWLGFEEKKGSVERKSGSVGSSSNSSGNSSSSNSSSGGNSSNKLVRSNSNNGSNSRISFLQETGKKDDRILEAQTDESLRNLSQARLRALLAAQQKLAESPLCKRLPDGGAKILKKLAQIQSALDFVIHVDALVMGLEVNMSQLQLEDKMDTKQSHFEVDPSLQRIVAKKVQEAQKAKTRYSQASLAIHITPDGTFRGVNPKYRSGPPKFLTLSEAEELHRVARQQALTLQEKEHPSAVIGSKGSAFRTAHWHPPEADFSAQDYREPLSDFDDDDDDDDEEEPNDVETDEEEDEDENEGDPPTMHLRPSPLADMLV